MNHTTCNRNPRLRHFAFLTLLTVAFALGSSTQSHAQFYPNHIWKKDPVKEKYYGEFYKNLNYSFYNGPVISLDSQYVMVGLSDLLLNTALSGDTASPDFWLAQGHIALQYGYFSKAEKAVDKAKKLDPNYAWIYYDEALLYITMCQGDSTAKADTFTLGLSLFDKALSLQNHAYFHVGRSKMLRRLGRNEESIAAAKSALALAPDVDHVQLNLYEAEEKVAGPEVNLKRVNRLINRFPSFYGYPNLKCQYQLQLGMADSFMRNYEKLTSINQLEQGRFGDSYEELKKAEDTKNLDVLAILIADFIRPYLKPDSMLAMMRSNPDRPQFRALLARAYINQGDTAKAVEELLKIPMDKTVAGFYAAYTLADIYIELKEFSKSLDICNRGRVIWPKEPVFDNFGYYCYYKQGDIKALKKYYSTNKKLYPKSSYFDYTIGRYYYDKGDLENATRHAAMSVSADPEDAMNMFLLAKCYHKNKHPDACDIYFQARKMSVNTRDFKKTYFEELNVKCFGEDIP